MVQLRGILECSSGMAERHNGEDNEGDESVSIAHQSRPREWIPAWPRNHGVCIWQLNANFAPAHLYELNENAIQLCNWRMRLCKRSRIKMVPYITPWWQFFHLELPLWCTSRLTHAWPRLTKLVGAAQYPRAYDLRHLVFNFWKFQQPPWKLWNYNFVLSKMALISWSENGISME